MKKGEVDEYVPSVIYVIGVIYVMSAIRVICANDLVVKVLDSQPGILCSKPLNGSKVDSAFYPSKIDQMSTRNFWELSGKK